MIKEASACGETSGLTPHQGLPNGKQGGSLVHIYCRTGARGCASMPLRCTRCAGPDCPLCAYNSRRRDGCQAPGPLRGYFAYGPIRVHGERTPSVRRTTTRPLHWLRTRGNEWCLATVVATRHLVRCDSSVEVWPVSKGQKCGLSRQVSLVRLESTRHGLRNSQC